MEWRNTHRHISLIGIPAYIFLAFSSSLIIEIIYTSKYLSSAPIFSIYIITYLYFSTQPDMIFRIMDRTKQLLFIQVIFFMTSIIFFSFTLYYWGIFVAIVSKSIMHLLFFCLKIRIASKSLETRFLHMLALNDIFKTLIYSFGLCYLTWVTTSIMLDRVPILIKITVQSLIYFPGAGIVIFLNILQKDEQDSIKLDIRNILKKIIRPKIEHNEVAIEKSN